MANAEKSEPDELTHARYVETYLDCLENLPDDLQILVSRMLELDACFQKYERQLDEQKEVLLRDNVDAAARSRVFSMMRASLARMHDIGDDKLQLVQAIHELIEKKARQLDIDFKNLRPKIEQENNEPLNGSVVKETNGANSQSNKITTPVNNEKITRRGRRTRTETLTETLPDSSVLSENQSSNLPSTSNGNQKKTNAVANTGRKKKRKVAVQQSQSRDDDSQSDDPDEPLYCICNQISYGKMILCDNDSCSLEWFHFNCVSLTTKPKGKWYCPQCRGNKPNIMKSKAQFR